MVNPLNYLVRAGEWIGDQLGPDHQQIIADSDNRAYWDGLYQRVRRGDPAAIAELERQRPASNGVPFLLGCGTPEPGLEPVEGDVPPLPPPPPATDAGPDAFTLGRNTLAQLVSGYDLIAIVRTDDNRGGRIRIPNAELRDIISRVTGDAGSTASAQGRAVWASEPQNACPPTTSCSNAVIARASGNTRLNLPGAALLVGAYQVTVSSVGDEFEIALVSMGYDTEGNLQPSNRTLLMVYDGPTNRAGYSTVNNSSDAGGLNPVDGGIPPLEMPDAGLADAATADVREAGVSQRTFGTCNQIAGDISPNRITVQVGASRSIVRPDAGVTSDAGSVMMDAGASVPMGVQVYMIGEHHMVVLGAFIFRVPKDLPLDGRLVPAMPSPANCN